MGVLVMGGGDEVPAYLGIGYHLDLLVSRELTSFSPLGKGVERQTRPEGTRRWTYAAHTPALGLRIHSSAGSFGRLDDLGQVKLRLSADT